MKRHFLITILTILFFILNPLSFINQANQINQINQFIFAQETEKQPGAAPAQPAPAISKHPFQILPLDVTEGYVLGQGDVLEVFVWRNEQLSRHVTVRPDGKISLPLIQDLHAEGLTALQLRDQITRRLQQYVKNPTVSVIVNQINSYKISVLGKVATPGAYPITTKTTLLEAISMAGGFTEWANQRKITVIRNEGGQKKKIRINYKKILSGKDPSQNITLNRGDTIVVP